MPIDICPSRSILGFLPSRPREKKHETIDDLDGSGNLLDHRIPIRPGKKSAAGPEAAGRRRPDVVPIYGLGSGRPRQEDYGKALADHLGSDAGAALPYGVTDVSVHRFKPATRTKKTAGREFVLEVFRMTSPDDAFGLFSLGRRSADRASPIVAAPNVVGAERAAFIKGDAYIEIRAKGCDQAGIEKIAAAAARRINLPVGPPPAGIARLPQANIVEGSERYIRGYITAGAESPLLNRDFWGFRAGTSRGYAARYAPKDSKLIVVEFAEAPEGLAENVLTLFKEYLEDVREENGIAAGADIAGNVCLFGMSGKVAALIIGEPDPAAARARLSEALTESGEQD